MEERYNRHCFADTNVTSLLRIADRYDARSVVADCERRLYGSDNVLKLKISNISTFMTKIHQRSESPRQQVAGIEWYILAYAQVIDNVTYLSCFLEGKNASKWTAWVDVSFRIVKGGGEFGAEGSFRHLMGNEPLENVVGCGQWLRGRRLGGNPVDLSVTDVCGDSFHVLEIAGSLAADVKLRVGDSVFYANKGYLSVMSSVFRNMFALSEAAEGKKEMEEIELKDLDASEFKDFLGVIYPTRYPVTDTNVTSLFRIADRYDAKTVVADCERHLFGSNNVPWFDKMKLAVDLNPRHLKDHLFVEMICEDIKTVNQNENMHQLVRDVVQALFDKYIRMCHP
ncbi:Protein BATH-38 [Aphelenchoides avenae]|nr:Protein BATH-38 [Aphelenchus avenae]